MWQYRGQTRPSFAEQPAAGQESVWDYPRPPKLEPCAREVKVRSDTAVIAHATECFRVLETASPPTFYLASQSVDWSQLVPAAGNSHCEWKGLAAYWALAADPNGDVIAWRYSDPHPTFAALHDYVSFYPGRVACYVNEERVRPQPGQFYGGWITGELTGPFKGEPDTGHW